MPCYVYFLTDDSCEPIDPSSLSINRMHKSLFIERYGNTDWTFDSFEDAIEFCRNDIE